MEADRSGLMAGTKAPQFLQSPVNASPVVACGTIPSRRGVNCEHLFLEKPAQAHRASFLHCGLQGTMCLHGAGKLFLGHNFMGARAALVVRGWDKIDDDIVWDLVCPKSPLEKDRGSRVPGKGRAGAEGPVAPSQASRVRQAPGRLPRRVARLLHQPAPGHT